VLMGAFTYSVMTRVQVGFDIVRDRNRLYRQDWDGSVENVYTLRIANRASIAREYRIAFESPLPLVYEGPEAVHIEAGEFASLPVRLVLSGEDAGEWEAADVRFQVRSPGEPTIEVDKTSRFHLPKEVPQ